MVFVVNYEEKGIVLEIFVIFIEDVFGFFYWGLYLDLVRNFNSFVMVKKVIELMGFYKLNKLYLYFIDDEGWCLEIEELLELIVIGLRRGYIRIEIEYL